MLHWLAVLLISGVAPVPVGAAQSFDDLPMDKAQFRTEETIQVMQLDSAITGKLYKLNLNKFMLFKQKNIKVKRAEVAKDDVITYM